MHKHDCIVALEYRLHGFFYLLNFFFLLFCFLLSWETGVVAMHIESLEPVYREYKNLAPIQKVGTKYLKYMTTLSI